MRTCSKLSIETSVFTRGLSFL